MVLNCGNMEMGNDAGIQYMYCFHFPTDFLPFSVIGPFFDSQLELLINPFPQRLLLTPQGNKPFENTVGKGEIARNEQFLLFPQYFLPVWITLCHFRQI